MLVPGSGGASIALYNDRLLCVVRQPEDELVAEQRRAQPHEAAVEETFVNDNARSALKLGHARACCLIAPARAGIAVRAGNHCAEPLMHRLGVDSSARASFGIYTTPGEIDFLADTLVRVREFFA